MQATYEIIWSGSDLNGEKDYGLVGRSDNLEESKELAQRYFDAYYAIVYKVEIIDESTKQVVFILNK